MIRIFTQNMNYIRNYDTTKYRTSQSVFSENLLRAFRKYLFYHLWCKKEEPELLQFGVLFYLLAHLKRAVR